MSGACHTLPGFPVPEHRLFPGGPAFNDSRQGNCLEVHWRRFLDRQGGPRSVHVQMTGTAFYGNSNQPIAMDRGCAGFGLGVAATGEGCCPAQLSMRKSVAARQQCRRGWKSTNSRKFCFRTEVCATQTRLNSGFLHGKMAESDGQGHESSRLGIQEPNPGACSSRKWNCG